MKMYGGVEVYVAASFLTLALYEGEWLASRPNHFTVREPASGACWIRGWVSFRAGLDAVEKRKSFAPAGNQTLIPWLSSP
jgi:hypothetical protein